MDSVQKLIETFVDLVKDYAGMERFQMKREYQLFLFGISIGLGRRLTPRECRAYHATRLTVEAILAHEDTYSKPRKIRRMQVVTTALDRWLENEQWLRPQLEARFGYEFKPPFYPYWIMPAPIQKAFIEHIRALGEECSEPLSEDEIKSIIHRLDNSFSPT